MKTIVNFIFKSSTDPRAVSLTVKAALVGIIPLIMQTSGMVCRFGDICLNLNPTLLEQIGSAVSELVFLALSAVSVIGIIYGLVRKLIRTLNGENEAIK